MLFAVSLQHHMTLGLTRVNTALTSQRERKEVEETGEGEEGGWVKGRKAQREEELFLKRYVRSMQCDGMGVDGFERF